MSSIHVLPKELQNGFAGTCIVGSLREDVELWREKCSSSDNSEQDDADHLELLVAKAPIMMCRNDVLDIISNPQYNQIKLLKKQMADDLREVDENVKANGIHAFDKVEENFYLAQTSTGAIWIYNYRTEKQFTTDDTKYINYYQVGKYSANANVAGTVDYIFHAGRDIVASILAAMVGKMIQIILQQGTKLVIGTLVDELMAFAAENGLETTVDIVENGASYLVQAFVFVLAFVGLDEKFDWETRRYTVQVSFYNWNSKRTLYVSDCYLDNVRMICNEQDMINRCETHMPPKISPGSQIIPPGFTPASNLDAICHYVTYFFENDATFLQGLGLALKVELNQKASKKGFMYAFKCPRFRDNRHNVGTDLCNYNTSKDFYNKDEWSENPLNFQYRIKGGTLRITLDALNGNDSYYRPIINYL